MAYKTDALTPTSLVDYGNESGGFGAYWINYDTFRRWWSGDNGIPLIETVQLTLGGVPVGSNKAALQAVNGTAAKTFSFTPANWGVAGITPAQIMNDGGLGLHFRARGSTTPTNLSPYLDFLNFAFQGIPADATITNITAIVNTSVWSEQGSVGVDVGTVTIQVTFDFNAVVVMTGRTVITAINQEDASLPDYQQTKLRYTAFDKDRNLLGDYKTESGTPNIKTNINELHSTYTLELAQNDLSTEQELINILTEAGDDYLTEAEKIWLSEITTVTGIDEGTNLDTNLEVDIYASYGRWVPWLTEDGDPIVTEESRQIIVSEGYPDGRKIYGGYVSSFDIDLGGNEIVAPNLLSHSQELNNILLTTEEQPANGYTDPVTYWQPLQNGVTSGSIQALGQVITITGGTKKIGSIDLQVAISSLISRGDANGQGKNNFPVTVAIHNTNNIELANDSNVLAKSTVVVIPYGGLIHFPFAQPVSLTSGSQYCIRITTTAGDVASIAGTPPIFIGVVTGGTYTGGTGKVDKRGVAWASANWDLYFQLWEAGSDIIRTFYTQDPSYILKQVLRFAQRAGSRVKFDDTTIENTGTVVTLQMNANTIDEAVMAVLQSMPADWYIWYDPATDYVHAHPRPTEATRHFTRGVDITGSIKVRKTIEDLTNDVLYSGGDLGGGTNLLVRVIDQNSIDDIRRGFTKLSDSRVKVLSTAQILASSEIGQKNKAVYRASATIVRTDYPLEDVTLGELADFLNISRLMDNMPALQIVSKTYKVETIDLEFNLLPPKISKRVEDIRRNLALQEMADNPVSPS